jgi:hypothetical protein
MIPTYTYAIKNKIITDYLGSNLAIILINNPNLGMTDTPTIDQLEARRNFTASNLINFEIGATALNGYRRFLVSNTAITPTNISTNQTEATLQADFTADGGNFNPITHVIALRGANITGANPLTNGNNRGDVSGTILFIEPVNNVISPNTPLIVQVGTTFNYTFKLISATEVI